MIQVIYPDTRLGGIVRWKIGDPGDVLLRIPDEILQCVVFLGVKDGPSYVYGGTAFFMGVKSEMHEGHYEYLVTAKHCIEEAKRRFGQNLTMRLNTRDGGAYVEEIPGTWIYHENPGSDVAVLPILIAPGSFEYKRIPPDGIVTKEVIQERRIGIGDDLIVVGLFTARHGAQRNLPVVRSGLIAAMSNPREPFVDDYGNEYTAYLAEVRSMGGLSGSPVFVYMTPGRYLGKGEKDPGTGTGFLLGLIRGHWDYQPGSQVAFTAQQLEAVNMGIAIVTPIQEALDILYGEDLMKQRRKIDKEVIEEKKRQIKMTEDAAFQKSGLTSSEFDRALKKVSRKLRRDEASPGT